MTATADVTIEDSITYDYVFFISGYNSITAGEDTEPYKVYYYTNTYTNGVLTDTGSDATLFTGEVTWSVTSGSQSGSISSAGVLHAIKEGTVRITASMTFEGSGRSAYKDVTVTKPSNAGTDTGWEDGGDVDYD